MPYAGSDFPIATAGEKLPYFFDFSNTLGSGETITSAAWTATVCNESSVFDPSASTIVSGPASVTGNVVGQEFANLVSGVKYLITCTIVTNQGNTLISYSHLQADSPS